jgi:hypothetical protein
MDHISSEYCRPNNMNLERRVKMTEYPFHFLDVLSIDIHAMQINMHQILIFKQPPAAKNASRTGPTLKKYPSLLTQNHPTTMGPIQLQGSLPSVH